MTEIAIEKPIDKTQYYFDGKPFTPVVASALEKVVDGVHNCLSVTLDASLNSKLNWDGFHETIQKALEKNLKLFFLFDFKLLKSYESFFDSSAFSIYSLSLQTFVEQFYTRYSKEIFGIGFLYGKVMHQFYHDPFAEEALLKYFKESYAEDHFQSLDVNHPSHFLQHEMQLYQVSLISEYFHRLAAQLPEELEIFGFFDFSRSVSLTTTLASMSLERFPYMRVALAGAAFRAFGLNIESGSLIAGGYDCRSSDYSGAKIGLVFPGDTKLKEKRFDSFETFLKGFIALNIPFRVLYEDFMTENWQELDTIVVYSDFVDKELMRKCQGFTAAGGQICSYGRALGVFDEIEYQEWVLKDSG